MPDRKTPLSIESLAVQIGHLDAADKQLRTEMQIGFRQIGETLEGLRDSINKSSSTNWPVLISLLVFLLSAFTVFGTVAFKPFSERLARVEAHAGQDGHPHTTVARIAGLEQRIDTLNASRDRERDLMYSYMKERIDRLDYYGSSRWKLPDDHPAAKHPAVE